MILYIHLATEKMWATSRKCVFYGIFKNTTKHQKIFSGNIFWNATKHMKTFSFPENSIPENGIFSGNVFTWTKHNLSNMSLWSIGGIKVVEVMQEFATYGDVVAL